MTTLAPSLGRGGFARRLAFLEPSMALWLVLIAVLVFLIASPMVRLVIASFQEPDTGGFTLANYVEAYGSLRHLRAVRNSLELGLGVAASLAGIALGANSVVSADLSQVGMRAIPAAMLGGLDSVPGALLGSLVVGIAEVGAANYLGSTTRDVATFGVMLVVILLRPAGLLGSVQVKRV